MRGLAFFIVPLALASCSNEQTEGTPVNEPAAFESEPASMVTANGSKPGPYEVTGSDGTVSRAVLNADGTYTDTAADGSVVEGTWTVTGGKTCFAPSTEGEEAMCFTETAPAEDGSFTATPDQGEPVTVRPLESETSAE